MQELKFEQLELVNGGTEGCEGGSTVGDQSTLGQDLIDAYEGLVEFVSHVFERILG